MRVVTDRLVSAQQAASTNTLSRFETEVLTQEENVEGLAHLNAAWVEKAMAHTPHRRVILDMDSSESPLYGEPEGAAYHGHVACVYDHPPILASIRLGTARERCDGLGRALAHGTGSSWSPVRDQ